jgi:alpha-2-macroglobulin-like protein
MKKSLRFSRPVALGLLAASLGSTGVLAAEDAPLQSVARKVEADVGAPNARTMYLATDKPLYHPGETVWFRAWELAVRTLEGVPGDHGVTFQLFDPRGSRVAEKRVLGSGGAAMNDFELSPGLAGGPYVLRMTSDLGGVEERPITISTYELPRVKKTLDFGRKSYSPAEEVTASFKLESATGEAVHGGKATAVITIDGAEIARIPVLVDWNGKGVVKFALPRSIARGDGLLTLLVDAGGTTESIQKRIPILLGRAELAAFPEGGDLVVGLPSRVYVSAHDPLGKPADFEGDVVDDRGARVAHVKSLHGGMARFTLTPEKGKSYSLAPSKALAATPPLALPAARPSGCTLRSVDDFRSTEPALKVIVHCTTPQKVLATAVLRERLIAKAEGQVSPSAAAELAIPLPKGTVGAVRLTLFDTTQAPLAERLVYRGLGADLHVSVTPDRPSYSPRDKVALTVKTTDAQGRPVPADVALSVVDDTVLNFASDKTGNILAQLYLEPEMPGQTVAEPNFYFSKDSRAPEALDLVLGTQGWRRFEWTWVKRSAAVAR